LLSALKYITLKVVKNMALLSALKYITLKIVKNMTVFMSLIYVICIKIYNFKGSKKYDRFYVIDFNFAKVNRNYLDMAYL